MVDYRALFFLWIGFGSGSVLVCLATSEDGGRGGDRCSRITYQVISLSVISGTSLTLFRQAGVKGFDSVLRSIHLTRNLFTLLQTSWPKSSALF